MQEIELDTRQRTRSTRFHRFGTTYHTIIYYSTTNTSNKIINDVASKLLENNIKILYGNTQMVYLQNDYINPCINLQFGNYVCHTLILLG